CGRNVFVIDSAKWPDGIHTEELIHELADLIGNGVDAIAADEYFGVPLVPNSRNDFSSGLRLKCVIEDLFEGVFAIDLIPEKPSKRHIRSDSNGVESHGVVVLRDARIANQEHVGLGLIVNSADEHVAINLKGRYRIRRVVDNILIELR